MPDLRLSNVTADIKPRSLVDQPNADFSGSQFLDTMLSSASAALDEPSYLDRSRQVDVAPSRTVDSAQPVKLPPVTDKTDDAPDMKTGGIKPIRDTGVDIKAKIKARLKEMAAKDSSPVKDAKALDALKKVAKFLAKADEEGKIDLPPEMVQKLNEFIAKGDDLKAFDIANFMTDFTDVFRTLTVQLGATNAPAAGEEPLQWPTDVVDSFKELGLSGLVATGDKPLDTMGALRAVKALVSESQKAAIKTLDENSQLGLSEQNPAAVLLGGIKPMPQDAQNAEAATPVVTPEAATAAAAIVTTKQDMQAALLALNELPQANAPVPAKAVEQVLEQVKVKPALVQTPQISLTKLATNPAVDTVASPANNADDNPKAVAAEKAPADIILKNIVPTVTADAQPKAEQIIIPSPVLNTTAQQNDQHAAPVISGVAGIDQASLTAPLMGAKAVMQNAAVQTLSNAMANAASSTPMQQVVVHIQQKASKSGTMSIQMTPAELGQVEVRLETSIDGKTRAVVMAEKPETLALLQKDATQLERALQQAGLNADAKNMSFNLRDQNNTQQFGQQGRKRFTREAITEKSGTEIALNVSAAGQIFSDTQINYHA